MYCYTQEYFYSSAAALSKSTFGICFSTLPEVLLHHPLRALSKSKHPKSVFYIVSETINTHIYELI